MHQLTSYRYTNGARIAETHFYESGWYPYAYIGPVTIIWQPLSAEMASARDRLSTPKPDSGKDAEGTQPHRRTVWIRTHPLIHEKVFDALKFATTKLLENTPQPGNAEAEVELSDLRDQVNVFEIMGPKANQVIHGAVKPASEDKREELKKVINNVPCTAFESVNPASRKVLVFLKECADHGLTSSGHGYWVESDGSPVEVLAQ